MIHTIDLSCFQSSYREARREFLQHCEGAPARLIQARDAHPHPLPGPTGDPLFLDWILLSQNPTPECILVLICGTHGVEGFTGSAIQSHYFSTLTSRVSEVTGLGVLMVHALNPWGFAWSRRYDHQGIDLNRNFVDFQAPLPVNTDYEAMHQALFRDTSAVLDTALETLSTRMGAADFEAAITRGQYQHQDGLFYGGSAPSWSRTVLEQIGHTPSLQQAKKIAVVDLHTGLGPYGHGEVINDHPPGTPGFDWACRWYGPNAQSALLGESCSSPKTGLLDYFWHDLIAERGCFVTLEYGTYSLDKLIKYSCAEQRYHNSYHADWQQRDCGHDTVTALRDFFYPRERTWQQLVLFRAGQIIDLALQGIRA